MRLHKTGHPIADTVSDLIGDLPDGEYKICYGILRHALFTGDDPWFELDKGFWGAKHFDGSYRLSYRGTQPRYDPSFPVRQHHNVITEPWRDPLDRYGKKTLICPPTGPVCDFFGIDLAHWFWNVVENKGAYHSDNITRYKGTDEPIDWDNVGRLITFNSTLAVEALRRGIPVISDPVHSTVGSYTKHINMLDGFDRDPLFSFLDGHQFKLHERERIAWLIGHYLNTHSKSLSDMTHEKPSPQTSASTR